MAGWVGEDFGVGLREEGADPGELEVGVGFGHAWGSLIELMAGCAVLLARRDLAWERPGTGVLASGCP